MARLVARALRIGRSALMQPDSLAAYQGSYRLSYLIPALLWPEPAVLALPEDILKSVLQQDIPNLQQGLPVVKPVQTGDRWPGENFRGLLVTSAQGWLRDRLPSIIPAADSLSTSPSTSPLTSPLSRFPAGIFTLIDGASDLERWARQQLSVGLLPQHWEGLMLAYPSQRAFIRDMRVRITHAIFQHPANPYRCHLIEEPEKTLLYELYELLQAYSDGGRLPAVWQQFWQQFSQTERLAWSSVNRELGSVALHCGPIDLKASLAPVWAQQPVVLIGAALDTDPKAERYRDRLGLGEMTCLRFGPDRHSDLIQLYLPDHLPMPNTSHYQGAARQEICSLISAKSMASSSVQAADNIAAGPTVIIVGDMPLKAQLAAVLAAEYGSRVQVEAPIDSQGILLTGWEYWRSHQAESAIPELLIITTLPIPSLENPLVAGRVAAYKRRRQDWFKAYLLPTALNELQQAVASVRSRQGVVALLDNRVNYRSYGAQIISALSPAARSSYLDLTWFSAESISPESVAD